MPNQQTRIFPARYESLSQIGRFIAAAAKCAGFDSLATYQVQLAVDEACSNIIEHAYGGESQAVIECTWHMERTALTITLRDYGQSFDPEAVPEPDLDADLEDRTGGGLGLYFIHHTMDQVSFDFESETGNVLTLVKLRQPSDPEQPNHRQRQRDAQS